MIFELSLSLLERLGLMVLFAFFMSRSKFFKNYIFKMHVPWFHKTIFAIIWGGMGILMTYMGTPVSGGIANSRTIPIVIAGLLGGPYVGILSGSLAGLHRFLYAHGGDLTALSCGISTVIGGIVGGYAHKALQGQKRVWFYGFWVGLVTECIQMLIILMLARPFEEALHLVQILFVPMTVLNAIGISIFLLLVSQVYTEQENIAAYKAQMALKIANLTLPHLRKGLTQETAERTASIIYNLMKYDAVAITNASLVLVHNGAEAGHHASGGAIWTNLTREVIKTGQVKIANTKKEIGCSEVDCTLSSVVIAPLKMNDLVVGTLKIYKCKENSLTKSDVEMIKGLAVLFSTQLDLANLEKQVLLREQAEINALRAQIKPHFLFNALNVIMSLTRTSPEDARKLLMELSVFLRSSFKDVSPLISIHEEMRFVEAYVNIEKARFPNKLNVIFDYAPNIEAKLPPLILQPLVENAIKHGIRNKAGKGMVRVIVKDLGEEVYYAVVDDGTGFDPSILPYLKAEGHVGLGNVMQRLQAMYHIEPSIVSDGAGTKISFKIPKGGLYGVEHYAS